MPQLPIRRRDGVRQSIFSRTTTKYCPAELPGLEAKDIDVRLENNVLSVKADRRFGKEAKEENYHRIEREYGSFSRCTSD